MAYPYSHPFLKRQDTMYLSTVTQLETSSRKVFQRESSFLKKDIQGSQPRILIPKKDKDVNYTLSTFVQQPSNAAKSLNRKSNPLSVSDIQGARPKNKEFRTKRQVNPLDPHYNLPSAPVEQPDKGRPFIRDNMLTSDINMKKSFHSLSMRRPVKTEIEGSSPAKLTKQIKSLSRLNVNDINKTKRISERRTDPLAPKYIWLDNNQKVVNQAYGTLQGSKPRGNHPLVVNKKNDFSLSTKDIDGAQVGSIRSKALFIDKRKSFRNYMQINDIDKSGSSSLKKGITTRRQLNPLLPNYKYPGSSQK